MVFVPSIKRVVRHFGLIEPEDSIGVPKVLAANVRWIEEYQLHGSSHALLPPLVCGFSVVIQIRNHKSSKRLNHYDMHHFILVQTRHRIPNNLHCGL